MVKFRNIKILAKGKHKKIWFLNFSFRWSSRNYKNPGGNVVNNIMEKLSLQFKDIFANKKIRANLVYGFVLALFRIVIKHSMGLIHLDFHNSR